MGIHDRYPQEVHDLVKEWCTKLRDPELAKLCNEKLGTKFTTAKMKCFRGNHGYKSRLPKHYTGEEYWKHQKVYPQGMYEFIRDNSWHVSSKEMAAMVNEKFGTDYSDVMIKQFRQRHGIRSGLTGWYQKGHPPGNKGKKLEEYITDPERLADIKKRISGTQFKKGRKPENYLPIGSVMKNSDGYLIKKVTDKGGQWSRWKFLHRLVWAEHYGPIPKGMTVIFKDGNRENCDISNLMMVERGISAVMSKKNLRFADPELTEASANMVRLMIKANKMKKGRKDERSDRQAGTAHADVSGRVQRRKKVGAEGEEDERSDQQAVGARCHYCNR